MRTRAERSFLKGINMSEPTVNRQTLDISAVETFWSCEEPSCESHSDDRMILLSDLSYDGIPICDQCGTSMELVNAEYPDESV